MMWCVEVFTYHREGGEKPNVNIYDISRQAGVSIATVSRVLNNSPHVSEATRRKVMKVIEGCGYVPNAFARGLGLNTMKTIGLLCPDAADPYLARALACLEHAFRQKQYDCLLCCTNRDLPARQKGVDALTSRHVDGMVLMGSTFVEDASEDNDYIRQAASSMPVVLLNGSFQCPNVYCVLCDDERAMREAMEQLLESGCKRVLYLYHSTNYSGRKKLAGCRAALEKHGAIVDERLLCHFGADKSSIHSVRDYLMELEKSGLEFDAVLASEDVLAVGAMKYAQETGKQVPQELSVVGYNNSNLCLCTTPELTSVDNRLPAICERIAETMIGVLEGREMPEKTVFTAEVIRRGSTREA